MRDAAVKTHRRAGVARTRERLMEERRMQWIPLYAACRMAFADRPEVRLITTEGEVVPNVKVLATDGVRYAHLVVDGGQLWRMPRWELDVLASRLSRAYRGG